MRAMIKVMSIMMVLSLCILAAGCGRNDSTASNLKNSGLDKNNGTVSEQKDNALKTSSANTSSSTKGDNGSKVVAGQDDITSLENDFKSIEADQQKAEDSEDNSNLDLNDILTSN